MFALEINNAMPKTFVLHDESLNSYGFWMPTSGVDISQFERNPIMLYMHNRSSAWSGKDAILPIGHWTNVRIEKGQILAEPAFDADDFSRLIADKVESGTLRMASVGAKPIETSNDPKWLKPGQTRETVTKWVLREASIVDLGSNDNALAFYDDEGKEIELSDGKDCPVKMLNDKQEQKTMATKSFWKLLGFTDDPSDDQAGEKIRTLMDENTGLKSTNLQLSQQVENLTKEVVDLKKADKEKKKAEGVQLVADAVKDGRINATQKEAYEKLFEADFDSAKVALSALTARTPVAPRIKGEKPKVDDKEYAKLADMSWAQLDKAEKLQTLKDNYPELYAEKFKEKFGKEPKE